MLVRGSGVARRLAAALDWLLSGRFLGAVLPRGTVGYVAAGAGVALMTVAIGGIAGRWGSGALGSVSVLYLLVVLPVAVRYGRGPAVFASAAAFLAHNWFHVQPLHTLTVADPQEWVALVLFLVVSTVTGALAAAQRRRAEEARRREREARALHELGRILSASDDVGAALRAVAEHLRAALDLGGCAVLLPDDPVRGGRAVARAVAGAAPPPEERATAEWLVAPARSASAAGPGRRWVRVHPPQRGPARRAAPRVAFVPLRAAERTVGVLRLARRPDAPAWSEEDARLVDAAADQIALAVERARLREEALDMEVLRRTDETRQALLASVSHDLRTPLASIKASAESLLQEEVPWTPGERRAFTLAIREEADRLNRLVENLLDVSRIEAGALRPARQLYPLEALVDDVVGRLRGPTARHRVVVDVPEDLPPVPLDYVLVGQALANLLENAVKHTPPGSTVTVSARQEGDAVVLAVTDDGPGIPAAALPRVFDKFFRVSGGDTARTPGTGLGLAVVRGVAEAHGGAAAVASPPPGALRGTRFTLSLPLRPGEAPPPARLGPVDAPPVSLPPAAPSRPGAARADADGRAGAAT
jgi:two-component system sensor histidine kinase KdpD